MNPTTPTTTEFARTSRSNPVQVSTGDADARLLERLRSGDERAYEELMRETGPRVMAVARRMLPCEEDARDAFQEAFLSAFKSIDRFDGRSRLSTWLHRIAVNACLMKLRSRRRRPERPIGDLLPDYLDDGHQRNPAGSWKPMPDGGIQDEEVRNLVRSKIQELPEPYREVLMLRDIEELDTESTATMLGISSVAVKTRLHRARQALKTLLDPYFAEANS